jgi:hypothetical protein
LQKFGIGEKYYFNEHLVSLEENRKIKGKIIKEIIKTIPNEDCWNELLRLAIGDYCERIPDRIPGWEPYDENNPKHLGNYY